MEITVINATDLNDAWFQALYAVVGKGYEYTIERGSYLGSKRRELDLAVIQIAHPGTRPLVPVLPPGSGFEPPATMEYVERYLPYLMTSAREPGEQYTYGQYLEPQIEKAIGMLRESPETNQAYMSVGDPSTIDLDDPPCLRGIDCRVRYGALHFLCYFRSWDLWGGFPANLAAIQLLKEYMASEIGVADGELIAMSKGLHLYEYAWPLAEVRTGVSYARSGALSEG